MFPTKLVKGAAPNHWMSKLFSGLVTGLIFLGERRTQIPALVGFLRRSARFGFGARRVSGPWTCPRTTWSASRGSSHLSTSWS